MKDHRKEPTWLMAKQALAHPVRVEMLSLITERGTGAGAGQLAAALGLPLAKVDYHLLVLRNADLIAPTDEADRFVAIAPGPEHWGA